MGPHIPFVFPSLFAVDLQELSSLEKLRSSSSVLDFRSIPRTGLEQSPLVDSCPCFCLLGPHIPAVKFFVDLRHHPYATTVFLAAKPCGGIGFRLAHHRPGNSSSAYFLWRRLQENERRCSCRGARGSPRWPESCFIRITTTFPRWLRFRPQPSCAVCSATTVIMAAKPAASFADIRGRFGSRHAHQRLGCSSSAYFLWCDLQEKLQRCSCFGLLAGLVLLHPHHHDLTRLVAALTFAQQRTRVRSRPPPALRSA